MIEAAVVWGFLFVCFIFTFTSIMNMSLPVPPFNGSHVTFPASIRCGARSIWGKNKREVWDPASQLLRALISISFRHGNWRRAPSTVPGAGQFPVLFIKWTKTWRTSQIFALDFSKGSVWGDAKCFFLEREQKQPGWFGNLVLCQPALHPWNPGPSFPPQVESLAKYRVIYKPYSRAEIEPSVKI